MSDGPKTPPIRTLTGRAKIAGVFGWPVTHSRSPRLHGYWLAKYNIDGAYLPFSTHPGNLENAIRALPSLGFRGANVTLPHKEPALGFVDEATARAQRIGAVNTIVIGEHGHIHGDNTDGFGFLAHLKASVPKFRASHGDAVVLGAGGAARAIVVALLDGGAPRVILANRTERRAEDLARDIGGDIEVVGWADRHVALKSAGLLVNTTQLGQAGQPPLEIDLKHLPKEAVVDDIVYVPMETALLAAAKARGNATVDGLGMLLHQARPGFAAWFGVEPEVTPELRDFVLKDIP
jgi:shikimate dehydrogenase